MTADKLMAFAEEETGAAPSGDARPEDAYLESFQIIAAVGEARSCYIKAVSAAQDGDFETADSCMSAGRRSYVEGHAAHAAMLQRAAAGEEPTINLIVAHAEDQLMSAEAFEFMAQGLIDVHRRLSTLLP